MKSSFLNFFLKDAAHKITLLIPSSSETLGLHPNFLIFFESKKYDLSFPTLSFLNFTFASNFLLVNFEINFAKFFIDIKSLVET